MAEYAIGNTVSELFARSSRSFCGIMNKAVEFITENQLKDCNLWRKMTAQFKSKSDADDNGWRGEFWGKLMRGGSVVYCVTKDDALYSVLKDSVIDLMSSADERGIISSYKTDNEFCGWDVWTRKYVMLGLLYFYEICDEQDLKERIVVALKTQADYIMAHVGAEKGKKRITETSDVYGGLNSCTVLEPFVKLYSVTSESKYLCFAEHILNEGGCKDCDLVAISLENKLYPYEYPVKKGYEIMSFFEGVLEYYSVTGEEKYFTSVKNFVDKVAESDLSIIGCCGSDGEEFNNSSVEQTEYRKIMQETCVTVTWMKLCYRLYKKTADVRLVDLIENSAYNALYSSVNFNFNKNVEYIPDSVEKVFLPFDSYSPLRCNRRGIVPGGYRLLGDNTYYGCCASIGAAGVGLVPLLAVMQTVDKILFNLYEEGEIRVSQKIGDTIFRVHTEYPLGDSVLIEIGGTSPEKNVCLRVPDWMENVSLMLGNKIVNIKREDGYVNLGRLQAGDKIVLSYTPRFGIYELNGKKAIRKGCLVYARDERFGEQIESPVNLAHDANGEIEWRELKGKTFDCYGEIEVSTREGGKIHLCDYMSAGSVWDSDKNGITVWM